MKKTILITGATDGIGLETVKMLSGKGHNILLHGRNANKLAEVKTLLVNDDSVETYCADLSNLSEVKKMAQEVLKKHNALDVLINNAGVYVTSNPTTESGIDLRFVVNTIAPYLITQILIPIMNVSSRVVNVSSAAQSPVNLNALAGHVSISDDGMAYAQSKLAITMWSCHMAQILKDKGSVVVAVNPKSLLGSKMVKEAYGLVGADLKIGADILVRAALSDEFSEAGGQYFDNDIGRFAEPHPDACNPDKCEAVVNVIEEVLATEFS